MHVKVGGSEDNCVNDVKPTFATELQVNLIKAFFQAQKRNYFQWFLSFCTQMEKFSYGFQVGSREP